MAAEQGFSVFWRPDRRRWVLSSPDSFGRWRQKLLPKELTKADKAEAHRQARDIVAGRPVVAYRPTQGPTIEDVADRWLALRKKTTVKRTTHEGHKSAVESWIRPMLGKEHLAAFAADVPQCRAFIRQLAEEVSPSRVHNIVSTLKALLDDAKAEGWATFSENPFRLEPVKATLPKARRQAPVYAKVADAQQLLDAVAIPLHRRARYALAFTSGLADGELSGLRWGDIDSEAGVATIERQLTLYGEITPLKSEHRDRKVPLHAAALAALGEWRGPCAVFMGRDKVADDDPIFPGMRRRGHARPDSARLLREDLEAVGVPSPKITMHATRRSFLTWLADLGVSREIRERLAGHRPSGVTELHYTARELDQLRGAVDMIGLTWGTVPTTVAGGTSDTNETRKEDTAPVAQGIEQRFPKSIGDPRALCPDGRSDESTALGDEIPNGSDASGRCAIHGANACALCQKSEAVQAALATFCSRLARARTLVVAVDREGTLAEMNAAVTALRHARGDT